MDQSLKSGCGCGGCNKCGNLESDSKEKCQGGCGGCEGFSEILYIDEYGEMDDIGVPAGLVVLEIIENHEFINELKSLLEQQGYEVLLSKMKDPESGNLEGQSGEGFTFYCNGELITFGYEEINDPIRRAFCVKKTEQQIVAPKRNRI